MIDKALAGLFKVVTDEAAANPAFAQRLEDSLYRFSQDLVATRAAVDRVAGFHPYIEFGKLGVDAFRGRLGEFDARELKLVVDRHHLDPAQTLKPKAAKKALIEHIVAAAEKRAARDAKLFEY